MSFMQQGRFMIEDQQKMLVLAGCFSGDQDNIAWKITAGLASVPEPEPLYNTNDIEADMRIWQHAVINVHCIYCTDLLSRH